MGKDTFEYMISLLGGDISYMGLKVQKTVDKYLRDLKTTHDQKKFCENLAKILDGLSKNTAAYVKALQNKIIENRKGEELSEVVDKLNAIGLSEEDHNCNKCRSRVGREGEASRRINVPAYYPDTFLLWLQAESDEEDTLNTGSDQLNVSVNENETTVENKVDNLEDTFENLQNLSQESIDLGSSLKNEEESQIIENDGPYIRTVDLCKSEPNHPNSFDSAETIFYNNQSKDQSDNTVNTPDPDFNNRDASDVVTSSDSSNVEQICRIDAIETVEGSINDPENVQFDSDIANSLEISHSEEIEAVNDSYDLLNISDVAIRGSDSFDSAMVASSPSQNDHDVAASPGDDSPAPENLDAALPNLERNSDRDSDLDTLANSSPGKHEAAIPIVNCLSSPKSDSDKDTVANSPPIKENAIAMLPNDDVDIPSSPQTDSDLDTVANSPPLHENDVAALPDFERNAESDLDTVANSPACENDAMALPNLSSPEEDSDLETVANSPLADPLDDGDIEEDIVVGNVADAHDSDRETVVNSPELPDLPENSCDVDIVAKSTVDSREAAMPCLQENHHGENFNDSDLDTVANSSAGSGEPAMSNLQEQNHSRDSDLDTVANSPLARSLEDETALPNVDENQVDDVAASPEVEDFDRQTVANSSSSEHLDAIVASSESDDGFYNQPTQKTADKSGGVAHTSDSTHVDCDVSTQKVHQSDESASGGDCSVANSRDNSDKNDINDGLIHLTGEELNEEREEPPDVAVEEEVVTQKSDELTQDNIQHHTTEITQNTEKEQSEINDGDPCTQESFVFDLEDRQNSQELSSPKSVDFDKSTDNLLNSPLPNEEAVKCVESSKDGDNLSTQISEFESIPDSNASDSIGDLSDAGISSDVQNEETTSIKPKGKIKEKVKQSLLKVIAQYCMKRQREKQREQEAMTIKNGASPRKTVKKYRKKETKRFINKDKDITSIDESDSSIETASSIDDNEILEIEENDKDSDSQSVAKNVEQSIINEKEKEESLNTEKTTDDASKSKSQAEKEEQSSKHSLGDHEATLEHNVEAANANKGQNKDSSAIGEDLDQTQRIIRDLEKIIEDSDENINKDVSDKVPPKIIDDPSQTVPVPMTINLHKDVEELDTESGVIKEASKNDPATTSTILERDKDGDGSSDSDIAGTLKRRTVQRLQSSELSSEDAEALEKDREPDKTSSHSETDSQVVSPFKRKSVQKLCSSEEDAEENPQSDVEIFKRKTVRQLVSSEEDEETELNSKKSGENEDTSQEGDIYSCATQVVNKIVNRFLSNDEEVGYKKSFDSVGVQEETRSEEDAHSSDTQVVSPFKKKVVKRLHSSEDEEIEPSQNVSKLDDDVVMTSKRRKVQKLLSLEIDKDMAAKAIEDGKKESEDQDKEILDENRSQDTQDDVFVEQSQFRLDDHARNSLIDMLDEQHDYYEEHLQKCDDIDKETNEERQKDDGGKETEGNQMKLNDTEERDNLLGMLSDKAKNKEEQEVVGGEAEVEKEKENLFELNDHERDDLLDMLSDKEKTGKQGDNNLLDNNQRIIEKDGKEAENEEPKDSLPGPSFKLNDQERDNLLDMFIDKDETKKQVEPEKDKEVEKEGDKEPVQDASQFKLNVDARDNFLEILNENVDSEETQKTAGNDDGTHLVEKDGEAIETETDTNKASEETDNAIDKEPTSEKVSKFKPLQFKLNEKERDELLCMLNDHILKNRDSDDEEKEGDSDAVSQKLDDVNRDMLVELLEEYEEAVSTGKAVFLLDVMSNKEHDNGERNALEREGDMASFDFVHTENGFHMDQAITSEEGSVILDVLREENFIQAIPSKRGRKKDNSKEAWDAYQQLLADDDDVSEASSFSSTHIDDINLDSSDVEMANKKDEHDYKELKLKHGVTMELVVNVEQGDIGKLDLRRLPKARRDSINVDRLCDLTNVLRKRRPPTPFSQRRHAPKRPCRRSSASGTSISLSDSSLSTDDSMPVRDDSTSDRDSPTHYMSDDSQEALANALWDNIRDSSHDSDSSLGGDLDSSGDEVGGGKGRRKRGNGSSSGMDSDNGGGKRRGRKGEELSGGDGEELSGTEGRRAWRRDPLLRGGLSSDSEQDSDASERRRRRNEKIRRKFNRQSPKSESDSDATVITSQDIREGFVTPPPRKTASNNSDSEVEFVLEKLKTPKKTDASDDVAITVEDSPGKLKGKGRRNIRALVEDTELAEATQKANQEEQERISRLEERQKAKEISFTQSQSFGSQLSEEDLDPLVLDLSDETQIKIHPKITKKLKPHQRDGIQFMWDSCYESVEQLKKGWEGSGCILAHCMGLGKTLQALALIHMLFNYKITKTKHVLVVCPLSTVSNWRNEYKLAFKDIRHCPVLIHTIQDKKDNTRKFDIVRKWRRKGGMLVLGYEAFGIMTNVKKLDQWERDKLVNKAEVLEALVNPGPDLVICDEGHLLRNKQTQRSLSLNKIKTKRRIVLTGTPLQNNLLEYYYMVHFVKPNLLGTEREYKTNFVNPIINGQFENSTSVDILLMKKRTHVLHKLLNKTVQRVEDTELKLYLPKLIDQALFIQLSDIQVNFYNTFLDQAEAQPKEYTAAGTIVRKTFLADVQICRYICTHPFVLKIAEKNKKKKIKEQDVIDDGEEEGRAASLSGGDWWRRLLPPDAALKVELGHKLMVALGIVEEAEAIGDKVLIFSQNHAEMDILELFLNQKGTRGCQKWVKKVDYFRMDGTIIPEERAVMCDSFNEPKNKRLRLLIMSTKVGGLGLNLTAANRVVIMNVHWNPSYDVQSVFRTFRFGQSKNVYVYRLIAKETMEERIYQRTVTKLAIAHRVVDQHQITRHYSADDIQKFYESRPRIIKEERALPNVPEDTILAKIIQRFEFLYKWHEHQALLANRPEEDLNEQQKNAAWEEFNKKANEPPIPTLPHFVNTLSLMNQPGPSGLGNKFFMPANTNSAVSGELFADHTYSRQTNPTSQHSSPSNLVSHPHFVDVASSSGPRPALMGASKPLGIPLTGNVKSPQNIKQMVYSNSRVRLGNSISISTPSVKLPSPAHSLKPSVSIFLEKPSLNTPTAANIPLPQQFNPRLPTPNVNPVSLANPTSFNAARVLRQPTQIRKIGPTPTGFNQKRRIVAPPTAVRPQNSSATTSNASDDPLYIQQVVPRSANQQPLVYQQQLNNFMQALESLKKNGVGAETLKKAGTGQTKINPAIQNRGVLKVGGAVMNATASTAPFSVAKATQNNITNSINSTKNTGPRLLSPVNKSVLHKVNVIGGQGTNENRSISGHASRSGAMVLNPLVGGANQVGVTRLVPSLMPVPKKVLVSKTRPPPSLSLGSKPKNQWSKVVPDLPTGNARKFNKVMSASLPTLTRNLANISDLKVYSASSQSKKQLSSNLQKHIAAKFNKLTSASLPKLTGNLGNNANLGVNSPGEPLSLSISQPSTSKANKENKKRKLSLRTTGNVAVAIDLSNEEDGNSSGSSLSQDVVDHLKKTGVSVNRVNAKDKDVINLD